MKEQISEHTEYKQSELDESIAGNNPFSLFESWLKLAYDSKVSEPNAMCLSTIGADNRPSSRIVLLRDYTYKGFIFYTNYKSRKGKSLKYNSYACLNFFWAQLEKQIRIEGKVQKLDTAISDLYFQSRPLESRIATIASAQSKQIKSREFLMEQFEKVKAEFEDNNIPRPDYWGGYLLIPDKIEFWQGKEHRLHDRLLFTKRTNKWKVSRLAP